MARVDTEPSGAEHVVLHGPDGGVIGESNCAGLLAGYNAVRAFFTDVRSAIIARDAPRTADLVAFPLRVNGGNTRMVLSRDQFLSERAKILTRDVIERVHAADPGQVFCNWQGNMLGDGVLWAELQPNNQLAVSVINLGSGPKRRQPSRMAGAR